MSVSCMEKLWTFEINWSSFGIKWPSDGPLLLKYATPATLNSFPILTSWSIIVSGGRHPAPSSGSVPSCWGTQTLEAAPGLPENIKQTKQNENLFSRPPRPLQCLLVSLLLPFVLSSPSSVWRHKRVPSHLSELHTGREK